MQTKNGTFSLSASPEDLDSKNQVFKIEEKASKRSELKTSPKALSLFLPTDQRGPRPPSVFAGLCCCWAFLFSPEKKEQALDSDYGGPLTVSSHSQSSHDSVNSQKSLLLDANKGINKPRSSYSSLSAHSVELSDEDRKSIKASPLN